jgi:hypothetical protein
MTIAPSAVSPTKKILLGITVRCVAPCGHHHRLRSNICGCGILLLNFHNVRSTKWIRRCLWCRNRRGIPTEAEIERIKSFCAVYDLTLYPLTLHENGDVYVY